MRLACLLLLGYGRDYAAMAANATVGTTAAAALAADEAVAFAGGRGTAAVARIDI